LKKYYICCKTTFLITDKAVFENLVLNNPLQTGHTHDKFSELVLPPVNTSFKESGTKASK
jgi:hypothetical protein